MVVGLHIYFGGLVCVEIVNLRPDEVLRGKQRTVGWGHYKKPINL
jgi:hypothetical protein